jgi:hypothetical protein
LRPQWAAPKFIAFAANLDEGVVTRRIVQEKIGDFDLRRLVSSCASVVKKEQERMVPASLFRR